MRELLERLLRAADLPTPERAQLLWDEYRTGAPNANPAFATLLAWYGGALYRRIWGLVRSDAAEDVFQNVLKKLHENRRKAGLANFHREVLPWLRTVADNECAGYHRRNARQRRGETNAAHPETDADAELRRELQTDLAESLAQLKPDQRAAIALHFFEGKDKQDAAAELGIDRGTFANRLNAGLTRLQQLLPAKAVLVLGAVGVPTSLSAGPIPLSAVRLNELVAAAWAKAGAPGWSAGQVAAVLAGLALCGSIAAGGWALTREPPRPEPAAPTAAQAVAPPRESLQAKNRRILKKDVIPEVLAALQPLARPDNPWRVDVADAYGSVVSLAIQRTKRIERDSMDTLHIRYCVQTRHAWAYAFDNRDNKWREVPTKAPVTTQVPISLPFARDTVLTIKGFEEGSAQIRKAFEVLPPDERAEHDQVRYLFGPTGWTGAGFTLHDPYRIAGNSRFLFTVTEGHFAYVRTLTGGWRLWGRVPSWFVAADESHLYHEAEGAIWSQRIDAPREPRVKVCALPPGASPRSIAVTDGTIFLTDQHPGRYWARRVDDPAGVWDRRDFTSGPMYVAARDGQVFLSTETWLCRWVTSTPPDRLLPPITLPSEWGKPVVWGDRVLIVPEKPGPIHARPWLAGPDVGWEVIGSVYKPPD